MTIETARLLVKLANDFDIYVVIIFFIGYLTRGQEISLEYQHHI